MLQCLDQVQRGHRNLGFIYSYAPNAELSFSLGKPNLWLRSPESQEFKGDSMFYCHGTSKIHFKSWGHYCSNNCSQ